MKLHFKRKHNIIFTKLHIVKLSESRSSSWSGSRSFDLARNLDNFNQEIGRIAISGPSNND